MMIRQDTVKWIGKRITGKNCQKSKVCRLTPNYAVCRMCARKRARTVWEGGNGKGRIKYLAGALLHLGRGSWKRDNHNLDVDNTRRLSTSSRRFVFLVVYQENSSYSPPL
jgi:hypothetical protein